MEQLVVSEDVFAYLKPTIVVMKYFGLAPIVYSYNKGFYTLVKSTKYLLYSYTIAIALAIWVSIGLYVDATSVYSFRIKSQNDMYVVLSDIGGVILSVLAGIFLCPMKIWDLFDVIHSLDNINKLLKESASILRQDKYNSLFSICAVYTVSTLVLVLDLYSWSERKEAEQLNITYVKLYFSFYLFYSILMAQQVAYNNLTVHVKRRVMSLNRILVEEILKTGEKQTDFIFWIELEKKGIFDGILGKNEVEQMVPRKLDKIKHFSRTYAELGKCVESINKFFDIPLMFILLSCFIHLIITIWGILVCYYTWWFFLFMNIVWIIIQGGRLIFVVEPIHSCLFEMSKTKPLVAKLMAETEGKEKRHQVTSMVKRLKTTELKFTAAGIVDIKRPMLCTIAGDVTTYLVILYQLHSVKRVY